MTTKKNRSKFSISLSTSQNKATLNRPTATLSLPFHPNQYPGPRITLRRSSLRSTQTEMKFIRLRNPRMKADLQYSEFKIRFPPIFGSTDRRSLPFIRPGVAGEEINTFPPQSDIKNPHASPPTETASWNPYPQRQDPRMRVNPLILATLIRSHEKRRNFDVKRENINKLGDCDTFSNICVYNFYTTAIP